MKRAAILVCNSLICIFNMAVLYHTGIVLDEHPGIRTGNVIRIFPWYLLLISSSVLITVIVMFYREALGRRKKGKHNIAVAIMVILLALNVAFAFVYKKEVHKLGVNRIESMAYKQTRYYRSVSLKELEVIFKTEKKRVVYVGRKDCAECAGFEKNFELYLRKRGLEITTYYTSKDRDGKNKDRMYALLNRLKVGSVPCVVLIGDKKILKKWNDPQKEKRNILRHL